MCLERTNYHTHCSYCGHASGRAEDYAEEAVRKGLTRLGFSDHLPFPEDEYGSGMPYRELEDYLQEISILKENFSGKLKIFCGFEGEFLGKQWRYYEKLLSRNECDYLILGQHFYERKNGEMGYAYRMEDTAQYEEYAENMVEAMKTGYFSLAAHPDMFFVNDLPWDIHCDRACDILVEGAARYHFPLEFNANGLRKGKRMYGEGERYQYPYGKFWDKVRDGQKSGGPRKEQKPPEIRVYVGSDCHSPEALWDEQVELAYRILAEKGIAPEIHLL